MSLYRSFKKQVRGLIPPVLWGRLSRVRAAVKGFLRWNSWRIRHPGKSFCCPYCKCEFGRFIPYINPYEITVSADIVSGQSIEDYACPRCLSNDRERALYFFIDKNADFLASKKILHFAPERNLFVLISASDCEEYICADLDIKNYTYLSGDIRKVDLTNIDFPDESFDVVICNHILEHIPDDGCAMREIFRVLKKTGAAIMMVPIGAKLAETYEDFSKTSDQERAVSFGQYDHVRVYNEAGYIDRLKKAGFEVAIDRAVLSDAEMARYGINPREKIYLGYKGRKAA